MCWKRHEYVAPTRRPSTPRYPFYAMNLTDNSTYYGNTTLTTTPALPCSRPDEELCPPTIDEDICSYNGNCCINRRVSEEPFCNCFTGFVGKRCQMMVTDDDWLLKELEVSEANRRAAITTLAASLTVSFIVLAVIVVVVVLIIVNRTKHSSSNRSSITRAANGTKEEDTEMQLIQKPPVRDTSTSLREKASEDMIANAHISMDDPTANGRSQPGLSWQQSVSGAPLDRTVSRSVPSGVDKLDHNSNA